MKIIYNIICHIVALALAVVLLCGCVSSFSTGTANLSKAVVERGLINGKTTKADVIALLGKPQSTVSGSFGGVRVDTWAYARMFYHDTAEKGYGYAILRGMANPYGSGYDLEYSYLSVTFDANGRVTGHMFGNSNPWGAQQ